MGPWPGPRSLCHQCPTCEVNWPYMMRYRDKCMICGGSIDNEVQEQAITQLAAEQMVERHITHEAKRARFEEYYAEREAARFRAQLDSPPLLSLGKPSTQEAS